MANYCNFQRRSKILPQRIKKNHSIVPLYFTKKINSLFSNS
jgi:hypothetical protein